MKHAKENCTPSILCCSIPCEDASRANRLTPFFFNKERYSCNFIGSKVVKFWLFSPAKLIIEFEVKPKVPSEAALKLLNSQICFKK